MELTNPWTIKKDFSEDGQILLVELSPFDLSQDLIFLGFSSKVMLFHLNITEKDIEMENLAEFRYPCRCTCLAISPETSINILPNLILFGVGGSDYKLRIFKSDLKGDDVCKVLSGHTSYINEIKFDPDNNYLASVSDDNTAKLWDCESFQCVATLNLSSPGVSTCWHRDDNSKLLVAEKIGLVRFYNVETQCPILSLDYGRPLSSAHWAPSDPQLIASLHLGELSVWDLSKPCIPVHTTLVFTEAAGSVRFSPFGELIGAINNLEGNLKVLDINSQRQKLSVPVTIPSNISWHFRYPLVCVGDYMKLCFYKLY